MLGSRKINLKSSTKVSSSSAQNDSSLFDDKMLTGYGSKAINILFLSSDSDVGAKSGRDSERMPWLVTSITHSRVDI